MTRLGMTIGLIGMAAFGCQPSDSAADNEDMEGAVAEASAASSTSIVSFTREVVKGDIVHYTLVIDVGDTPSAELALHRVVRERSPWVPRHAKDAVMFLHGDFATFTSNFLSPGLGAPGDADHGLAGYLAGDGVDVWGVDRRWTRTLEGETDLADHEGMTLAQSVSDTEVALGLARAVRALTGSGAGKMMLGGFSHGGQIAYEVAGAETQKPLGLRHVKALIPIDIYDAVPPGDADAVASACQSRDDQQALIDQGFFAGENTFFAFMVELAETAPLDPSPIFPNRTNRGGLLNFLGRTWVFFAPTATYHLAGGVISGRDVLSLRYSPDDRVFAWVGAAPPWQALPEGRDLDAIWCNDGPRPLPDHLADITVPIFYLGAKGGFGDAGLYTTTLTGSSDVTTLVVSRPVAPQESEDFGHADLLFSDEAPALAWEPLASWIAAH